VNTAMECVNAKTIHDYNILRYCVLCFDMFREGVYFLYV
jgi:hypothetical protein